MPAPSSDYPRALLPDLVGQSPIIAIGKWRDAGEFEATLVVDESLKGTEPGAMHTFDNRQTYTRVACSPYEEDFHEGFRFADGERSLVFLERQVDGLWQIGWSSYAAFDVPADDLEPMSMWPGSGAPVLLEDVRTAIAGALPIPGADIEALEATIGCKPPLVFNPDDIPNYLLIGTAGVALITIVESPPVGGDVTADRVVAHIEEVLAGEGLEAGQTVTLNDRWITDTTEGDCLPSMEDSRRGLREGVTYLAFLRPDDNGVAELRAAAWGQAIVSVNEKYITGDLPVLAEIRALTGVTVPVEEPTPPPKAVIQPTLEAVINAAARDEGGGGSIDWNVMLFVALGCLATVAAAWFVIRNHRTAA